jgi:hypothetical protein
MFYKSAGKLPKRRQRNTIRTFLILLNSIIIVRLVGRVFWFVLEILTEIDGVYTNLCIDPEVVNINILVVINRNDDDDITEKLYKRIKLKRLSVQSR